jgi:hypothetical protein
MTTKHWTAYTSVPPPGPTAKDHLDHVLAYYADEDADRDQMVIMITSNVYGDGLKTGLTIGDLFALQAQLDARP